jgi:hypothetical protein
MVVARSVVAVGAAGAGVVEVCANATVASNAEPARPAATDFANMMFLPIRNGQEKTNSHDCRSGDGNLFYKSRRIIFSEFRGTFIARVIEAAPCSARGVKRNQKPLQ